MSSRMQHLLRTTSALLVLIVLLSGAASSVTAREARQDPAGQIVQGTGDFPRLPVVAPGADGTLALYMVEDDRATQVMAFEGLQAGHGSAVARLSPDGKHIALLRGGDGASLEVVEVATADRLILDRGAGDLAPEKGAAHERITSLAWLDDEHLLYSKVTSPSSAEWMASWEAGVPPPIQGEVWLSDVDARERRPLASGRIHRVLGASPDGQTLYVTRFIPGREENREEGFALVDVASGEMKSLWPPEERGAERYFNFTVVALPDGTRRWLFATAQRVDTAPTQPPVIWMGDVESGQAEAIWTVDRGNDWSKGEMTGTIYDIPTDYLWSPDSEREFVYLAGGVLDGVWRVDLDAGTAEPLPAMEAVKRTGLRLLAWTPEGIAIQNEDTLWLLDEGGEVRGEIRFRQDTALASAELLSTVVNWDVPYIHQLYDTPAWFDGHWACGPTSAVMALAYYQQLASRAEGYGWYVPNQYTQQSACSGATAFNVAQRDAANHDAWGAYGWCTGNGVAWAYKMYDYAQKHDVGYYYEDDEDYVTASWFRPSCAGKRWYFWPPISLTEAISLPYAGTPTTIRSGTSSTTLTATSATGTQTTTAMAFSIPGPR